MANISTKEYIESVFINQLKVTIEIQHHFHAFMIMCIGIEFLGKCRKIEQGVWNSKEPGESSKSFKKAIQEIPSLKKYKPYLKKYDLYDNLRCSLLHSAQPGTQVTFSSEAYSKNEKGHLVEHQDNGVESINLKCEEFYADFKEACEWVINQKYDLSNKMNDDFLSVPDSISSSLYGNEDFIPTSSASIPYRVK